MLRIASIALIVVLAATLPGIAACGGRSAPSLWWSHSSQNNTNDNSNANDNVPPTCGNGTVEPFEPCDGRNLNGENCITLAYDGGTLVCSSICMLDDSGCWICGDGICAEDERGECPWDCEGECGDGYCDVGEPEWCPQDCEGWCGDGYCGEGEPEWCPQDCEGWCGDGYCDMGEPEWCPWDCEGECGDGYCDEGEPEWCPQDCEAYCGDGYCDEGEPAWCPEDCEAYCGNGVCEPMEDASICPQDCGTCGDGVCAVGEETWCHEDCGTTTTTLSCQAISLCLTCCNADDTACRQACRQAGDATARSELTQYRTCAQSACPGICGAGITYDCLLCARTHCTGICGFGAVGQEGCDEILTCTGGCGTVSTGGTSLTCPSDLGVVCRNTCWAESDAQAASLYEALMSCVAVHCGTICAGGSSTSGCQTCIYQQCGAEAGTCLGD